MGDKFVQLIAGISKAVNLAVNRGTKINKQKIQEENGQI
mgnify:CR=1 FL=1